MKAYVCVHVGFLWFERLLFERSNLVRHPPQLFPAFQRFPLANAWTYPLDVPDVAPRLDKCRC